MTQSQTPLAGEEIGIGSGFVYTELLMEFSPEVVAFLNGKARVAPGLPADEWVDFEPGEYVIIGLPVRPLPRPEGRARYDRIGLRIDGRDFRLREFPRLFSSPPGQLELFRNGPTFIPSRLFPIGFLGQFHLCELFDGDRQVFGPSPRFFASHDSGIVYRSFDDGAGRLVATISKVDPLFQTGHGINPSPLMAIWTGPSFGEPTGARQVDANGVHQLSYQVIGKDYIGELPLFNEGVLMGLRSSPGPVRIEVDFPNRGSGLANIMWGGYTMAGAFRPDAIVT
jgi:hypothetical protein